MVQCGHTIRALAAAQLLWATAAPLALAQHSPFPYPPRSESASTCSSISAWVARQSDRAKLAAADAGSTAKGWYKTAHGKVLGQDDAPMPWSLCVACRNTDAPANAPAEPAVLWTGLVLDPPDQADFCLPPHIVLLVHGLDEGGEVWTELAPVLLDSGYTVAQLDYPNDQPISASADILADSLRVLRSRGVKEVDIVAHSMGGLVARDVLTRQTHYACDARHHADLPDLRRLIMLGTPHHGAALAFLEPIGEAREHIIRHTDGDDDPGSGVLRSCADGRGEAGNDLRSGSAFLTDLNNRPCPTGVAITNIVGHAIPRRTLAVISASSPLVAECFGKPIADRVARFGRTAAVALGDGLVTTDSARCDGADTIDLDADHRSMIRQWDWAASVDHLLKRPPHYAPAIPIILDRLGTEPDVEN